MIKFEIGQKFIDSWERTLELVEIDVNNVEEPYVLSYYDNNQWNVSTYSEDELNNLQLV